MLNRSRLSHGPSAHIFVLRVSGGFMLQAALLTFFLNSGWLI